MAVKAREPRAWVMTPGKKRQLLVYEKPKKLSKFGKWMEAHPNGEGVILDIRAVMR